MSSANQFITLFVLAIPIACIAWTVTHEEVFRELHEWCVEKSTSSRSIFERKFFYLFTCEYCFSHYVTIFFLIVTRYTLLFDGWRGYLISLFSLVFVANLYMSFFGRLRLDIRHERVEIEAKEEELGTSSDGQGAKGGTKRASRSL
jgi:hypothetical protein